MHCLPNGVAYVTGVEWGGKEEFRYKLCFFYYYYFVLQVVVVVVEIMMF